MKKLFLIFLSLVPFTLFCEEGAHHTGWLSPIWGIPVIVWQFVNLVLVVVLFYFLLKVRLPSFLRARKADIEKALNKAKEERILAEKKLEELQEKFSQLDEEVIQIIKEAEKNAEKEREILRKNAEENANWLRKEAEEEFKRKQIDAERRIKEFAVNQAIEIAKNLIVKHLSPDDRERIFSEFVEGLRKRVNG